MMLEETGKPKSRIKTNRRRRRSHLPQWIKNRMTVLRKRKGSPLRILSQQHCQIRASDHQTFSSNNSALLEDITDLAIPRVVSGVGGSMTIEGLLPVIGRVFYSKDFMVSVISQSRIVKNRCLDLVYLKVEDKYRRPRSQAGTNSSWCSRRTVCAQAQGDSRSLPCCEERPMVRPPTYLCPLVSLLHCIAHQHAALTPTFRPIEPEGELYRIKVKFKRDL
jgi:hypothetical protein